MWYFALMGLLLIVIAVAVWLLFATFTEIIAELKEMEKKIEGRPREVVVYTYLREADP